MNELEIMLQGKPPEDPAHEYARKARYWLYDLQNLVESRLSDKMRNEIYFALGEWLMEESIEKIAYCLFAQDDTKVLLSLDHLTQILIEKNTDEKNSYQ